MSDVNRSGSAVGIALPDGGEMGAYLALPPSGKGPGIVLIQEIFGVNSAMRRAADEFAAAGYVVAVPDLFWRLSPGVELGYSEDERTRAFGLMNAFDFGQGVQDLGQTLCWLDGRDETVGGVALLGFCMGGKLAVIAGAANPQVAAVISFYGVKLDDNLEQIRSIGCPLQIHVGDKDSHVPMETVATLGKTVEDIANAELFVYAGAEHAFFNGDRGDVFHPAAAKLAMERTLKVLGDVLD